jgi:hypothetical protein
MILYPKMNRGNSWAPTNKSLFCFRSSLSSSATTMTVSTLSLSSPSPSPFPPAGKKQLPTAKPSMPSCGTPRSRLPLMRLFDRITSHNEGNAGNEDLFQSVPVVPQIPLVRPFLLSPASLLDGHKHEPLFQFRFLSATLTP